MCSSISAMAACLAQVCTEGVHADQAACPEILTHHRDGSQSVACCLQDYDEQGDYIRTWVPELAKVPAPSLFEPWRLSRADQDKYGVQIGVSSCPSPSPQPV